MVGTGVDLGEGSRGARKGERVISEEYPRRRRERRYKGRRGRRESLGGKVAEAGAETPENKGEREVLQVSRLKKPKG